jgi:hypothetical protein
MLLELLEARFDVLFLNLERYRYPTKVLVLYNFYILKVHAEELGHIRDEAEEHPHIASHVKSAEDHLWERNLRYPTTRR